MDGGEKLVDAATQTIMDEQQLETLGRLAEKAENFLAWGNNPKVHPRLQVDAMKHGLGELATELKALYIELAGHDPWQD